MSNRSMKIWNEEPQIEMVKHFTKRISTSNKGEESNVGKLMVLGNCND